MKSTSSLMMVIFLLFSTSVEAADDDIWETSFGLNLGSSHIGNDLRKKPGFNEINLGGTIYLTDKGENLPFIDEVSLSFIQRNSYGDPSLYAMTHHDIFNSEYLDIALSGGIATGYTNHLIIAERLGFLPVFGIRLTIMKHLEVGVMPSGVFDKKNGANTLIFSYRF